VYVEQLSAEARKVLVEAYVALRRGDALPGSQVAYRITVRQLEGLVRLSEAIARCHLSSEVRPDQFSHYQFPFSPAFYMQIMVY
jgi:DNA replicative helicase MCM subunit Mcm2 (Cdc46/Mcm family)